MKIDHLYAALATLLLPLVAGQAVADTQVYRWVSADGVVHFSQWVPDETGQSVTLIDIEKSNRQDYTPDTDPYSVLNQSARIHDRWTRLRAEADEAKEQPAADAASPREAEYYFPAFHFGHSFRPPVRNPFSLQRKQLRVIDEFERLPIPHARSINSSWHRARVDAQQEIARNVIRSGRHRGGHH